jgi:hypothetical protein
VQAWFHVINKSYGSIHDFLLHNARGLPVVMNQLPPVGTHKLNDILHVRGVEMPLKVFMN